ncbi:MAG: hypothetical protein R8G01_09365 [Ilumatobacteraceae bacterium]|nr:hypothetical protein [Ilumatobacteraceae bacterium]
MDDSTAGMTADDYVDMYRHVVGKLRSAGVNNVVYVMNYMGFERWAPIVDALYPGDDVVDWIAYDPYAFERHTTFAHMLNDPNDAGWPGFYEWATAKMPGTPIMLAEWGFDLATNSRAADIVREAPDTLRTQFPAIKALVYWNDRARSIDARLSGDAAHANEFADALNEVASHEYFAMTPTPGTP